MADYEKSTVVQVLTKPSLVLGVPQWYVSLEVAFSACMIFGLGWFHPATIAVLLLFFVTHPYLAAKCREDPYAIEIFLSYVRRPVVWDGIPRLGAKKVRALTSVPRV